MKNDKDPNRFLTITRLPLTSRLPEAPIMENLRAAKAKHATDILVGDIEWAQLKQHHAQSGQLIEDDEPLTMAGIRFLRLRTASCWITVQRV